MERFLKVNVVKWVCETADRVKDIEEWNQEWINIYYEIGGTSDESARKGCPLNAAKTLWYLGRLRCSNRPFMAKSYREIRDSLSKNGVYAIIAIDILNENPRLPLSELWIKIKKKYEKVFPNDTYAFSNQGGPTLAYKLWHMDQIRLEND